MTQNTLYEMIQDASYAYPPAIIHEVKDNKTPFIQSLNDVLSKTDDPKRKEWALEALTIDTHTPDIRSGMQIIWESEAYQFVSPDNVKETYDEFELMAITQEFKQAVIKLYTKALDSGFSRFLHKHIPSLNPLLDYSSTMIAACDDHDRLGACLTQLNAIFGNEYCFQRKYSHRSRIDKELKKHGFSKKQRKKLKRNLDLERNRNIPAIIDAYAEMQGILPDKAIFGILNYGSRKTGPYPMYIPPTPYAHIISAALRFHESNLFDPDDFAKMATSNYNEFSLYRENNFSDAVLAYLQVREELARCDIDDSKKIAVSIAQTKETFTDWYSPTSTLPKDIKTISQNQVNLHTLASTYLHRDPAKTIGLLAHASRTGYNITQTDIRKAQDLFFNRSDDTNYSMMISTLGCTKT